MVREDYINSIAQHDHQCMRFNAGPILIPPSHNLFTHSQMSEKYSRACSPWISVA
jgi:hypothetical protein